MGEIVYTMAGETAEFVHVTPADAFTHRGRRYGGTVMLARAGFAPARDYAWMLTGPGRGLTATRAAFSAISAAVSEAVAAHVAAHPEVAAEGARAAASFQAGQAAVRIAAAEEELALLRAERARLLEAAGGERTASGPDRGAPSPAYLRGVLTVDAELSAGRIGPHGWMRADSVTPVLAALSYADGTAGLVTEDGNGRLTRLGIPGQAFLRLIDGAERQLATSREQREELQRRKDGQ